MKTCMGRAVSWRSAAPLGRLRQRERSSWRIHATHAPSRENSVRRALLSPVRRARKCAPPRRSAEGRTGCVDADKEGAATAALGDGRLIIDGAIGDGNERAVAAEEARSVPAWPRCCCWRRVRTGRRSSDHPRSSCRNTRRAVRRSSRRGSMDAHSLPSLSTCQSAVVCVSLLSKVRRRRRLSGDQRSQKAAAGQGCEFAALRPVIASDSRSSPVE